MTMKAPDRGQATVTGRNYDALLDILEDRDAEIGRLRKAADAARARTRAYNESDIYAAHERMIDALAELDEGKA